MIKMRRKFIGEFLLLKGVGVRTWLDKMLIYFVNWYFII